MSRSPERILDEYLVVLSQSGSREALSRLVARWTPRLARYAARTLGSAEGAEDVVQETWSSALRGLAKLGDPARFPAWMYGIATRRCTDLIRRRVRVRRLSERVAVDGQLNGHASDPAGIDHGLDLAAALRRLPAAPRLAISLHYCEDLGVDEVAEVLGVPIGAVKSRLHAARATLKLLLEGPRP